MKIRIVLLVLALLALAPGLTAATAQAAGPTYGDFSLMDKPAYGQVYAVGTNQVGTQWAWLPQENGTSRIVWAKPWPAGTLPSYQEEFQHAGDWVLLNGWYDNGTFYRIRTTIEWQAASDCRTGRMFLPAGGPEHYVRWDVPAAGYCLYAEYTITEELTGYQFSVIHQQVWSPPAVCPQNAAPNSLMRPGDVRVATTDCIGEWESYADDKGRTPGDFVTQQEGGSLLARGYGMGYQIRRTVPAWSGDERYAALYG